MIHSAIDVARMAREAGISNRENRTIFVAICRAESGFDDQARLDNTKLDPPGKGIDRGLMQLNSHWQPQVSDTCAYDPICNVAEAVKIYKNWGSFKAWNTFKSGSHLRHMEMARVAVEADIRQRDNEALIALLEQSEAKVVQLREAIEAAKQALEV